MELQDAPLPLDGTLLQCRAGKVKVGALKGEFTLGIFKKEHHGPIFCTETGLVGNEHANGPHGGTERAVHAYNPDHYEEWRVRCVQGRTVCGPGGVQKLLSHVEGEGHGVADLC